MTSTQNKEVTIMGAGLVGSLLALYMIRRDYRVVVYEKRQDMRRIRQDGGRSINLALSDRGLRALNDVGLDEKVRSLMIPMKGRMLHGPDNDIRFQPYGKAGQHINSIPRGLLNELMINEAEERGAVFHFGKRCTAADLTSNTVTIEDIDTGGITEITSDLILGADGAFSAIRSAMEKTDRFNYEQFYIEHGYKELTIPPTAEGHFAMEKNALHIWPRGRFMFIALPNPDKSFTCTLFFPFSGEPSFESLTTQQAVELFFKETFPDATELIPNLTEQYFENPTSSLVTIRCFPWVANRFLILGDASHAIVPFYGQGMNAGFEDCYLLDKMMDKHEDLDEVLREFQLMRKPDADAIAELALSNFIEMRDRVADPQFLLQKKIEAKLHDRFPDQWMPLYSMVTFSHMPYSEAMQKGVQQDRAMKVVMKHMNATFENYESLNYSAMLARLKDEMESMPEPALQRTTQHG
ncbi:FAD-dependent oxidoreductase [Roseivirga sp. BDSF3-8]|uniref:FAD-dependent oxidoreductase n=1 Tax=Roseivirga sp. BDSF3-8 TaxID=3241598 RepID=UPI003532121B